jgi:hypothetical protein
MDGAMHGMKRTTLYLTDELRRGIEELAVRRQQSEAQVLRDAIAAYLLDAGSQRPRLTPLFDIPETLSGRVDDLLAEGFGFD